MLISAALGMVPCVRAANLPVAVDMFTMLQSLAGLAFTLPHVLPYLDLAKIAWIVLYSEEEMMCYSRLRRCRSGIAHV